MRTRQRLYVFAFFLALIPGLSCLTLKQKQARVTESVAQFMREYSKRDSGNVTNIQYAPLTNDSLLKKMSRRRFKRELNDMKNSMSQFLDTLHISTDSIFVYNGVK